MKYVYISSSRPFVIGRQGENEVTTVRFAINKFFPDLTNATFGLLHQRPGDAAPYICSITNVDGFIDWVITSGDLANVGSGTAQLSAYVDNKIAKTAVFTTMVLNSMGAFDPPDPQQIWIDEVIQAGNDAKAAAEQAEEIRDSIKPEIVWVEVGAAGSVIEEAYNAGKLVMCKDSGDVYQLTFRDSDERYVFTAVKDRVLNTRIVQYDYWFPVLRSSLATVVYVDEKASDDAPADLADTPSAGTSRDFSRADHVHKKELLVINEYETSNAKIEAAYQAGVLVLLKYQQGYLPLVSRNSATKHTFIGFAEPVGLTQAVLNNGTWSFSSSKVVTQSFAANTAPKDLGAAASSGTSEYFSRADHVHKMPSAADVGAYVKPASGIPASDLASAVQASLGKADSALQTAPVTSVNGETGDVELDIPNIDPDAKTSSMTQSVGVDSSGKLWTAPGGGGSVTVDDALSDSSTNPVQNKVVKEAVDAKYTKPATGIPASDLAAGVIPEADVFWATYDTTTAAEIFTAYSANKVIICKYNGRFCPLVHVTGQSQFEFAYPHENNIDMLIVAGTNWSYWPYQLATQGAVEAKITAPSSPATGAFLVYNGSAWTAQTLATWQGGNY